MKHLLISAAFVFNFALASNENDASCRMKYAQAACKLFDKAIPYSSPKEISGGSGGALAYAKLTGNKVGQYIRTSDLTEKDIGYVSSLRTPDKIDSNLKTKKLADFNEAPVGKVTNMIFASGSHSGSSGLVRLGLLKNGRPVVLKTIYLSTFDDRIVNPADANNAILEDCRSTELVSQLGIGPRFHGIYKDSDGKINIVMDIVSGDFDSGPVTKRMLLEYDEIVNRVHKAGYKLPGDFQFFRTVEGGLQVIDAAALISVERDDTRTEYSNRFTLLEECPLTEGVSYLEDLRLHLPQKWGKLIEQAHSKENGSEIFLEKYKDYLKKNRN